MSKLRHTLQLLHGGVLSTRQIGAALGISKSTVSEIASYARVAGVDWALAQSLNDDELQARLYKPPVARESRHLEPDHAHIHRELRRPGVTLQLLWEEYQQQHSGQAYKYSAFCEKYKAWARRLQRSMRQTHTGGDKLFVDYAGQTVPVVDADTGEIRQAQVFVAVLGASNYTYACATASQKATDWVASIIGALEFIGGVPRLLVPDQPRAFRDALSDQLVRADLVITSGGVSEGDHDVVKAALLSEGVTFDKVAMQPGKPQGYGTVADSTGRRIPIICLKTSPATQSGAASWPVGTPSPKAFRCPASKTPRCASAAPMTAPSRRGWRRWPGRGARPGRPRSRRACAG